MQLQRIQEQIFSFSRKKKQIYYKLLNKHKCNTKITWKILSTILGKSNGNSRIALLINGENVVDKQKVANCFNKHFATVAQKLVDKLPKPTTHFSNYLQRSNAESLYLYATSPLEIKRIIMETKSKSSSGLDDIPSKLLKLLNEDVLIALSYIFNLSLKQGKFIDCFKVAKIVPVYKSGKRNDINNYRPISLLSKFSKLLEKIVYKRLSAFFTKHNILFELQFGFRKNRSTSQAATLLIENISHSMEEKKSALCVFLDLSKAFDTIEHSTLLSKMYHYGIRGVAHNWFTSYQENRSQYVLCSNTLSSYAMRVSHGVPQGSNLDPLLFLIYVNDTA